MRLFGVGFDAPAKADHGSLVQERQAAKQQTHSVCCIPSGMKESALYPL